MASMAKPKKVMSSVYDAIRVSLFPFRNPIFFGFLTRDTTSSIDPIRHRPTEHQSTVRYHNHPCVSFVSQQTRSRFSVQQFQSTMRIFLFLTTIWVASIHAFAPVSTTFRSRATIVSYPPTTAAAFKEVALPPSLQRQRKSVAPVQTMGLFGLGAPEIAIILVAAAFLLGPSKLAELGKDAGKIAGELKEVPKEFQAGMAEGEEEAKKMKLKEVEKEETSEEE